MLQALYVIIVNWNLKQDTIDCILSLTVAGCPLEHIIVVDNGSTDGSVQALRDRFSTQLIQIESQTNLGFGGGSNLGIDNALAREARWILVLNNDTYVAPSFLIELEQAVRQGEEYSIFGPLILYHDRPERIWYFGDRLLPGLLATRSLYRGIVDQGQFPDVVPVDFVNGCCMLVKSEVFRSVGSFDANLFMYGEEVDLCWRAHKAGYRLAVATKARMWHKVSVSSNRDKPAARYQRIRNQILFYRKYGRNVQLAMMFGFTCLRTVLIGAGDALHGRYSLLRPLLSGWLHGWTDHSN